MEVFEDFSNYHSQPPLALSLGMFDGVHKGHQSIINKLNNIAKERGYQSAVLSFWPHPRLVINPNDDLKLLNTIEEKSALLEEIGVDFLFLKKFDEDFRNLTGEEFVRKILVETLHVKYLIVGYDHVFGKNKSGNFQLLEKLAPELGFEVLQVEAVDIDNQHISSTKIRAALADGNILQANEMLGYSYSISGEVIHGKKIGRTINFPTANINFPPIKILPKNGAYIVEVYIENHQFDGMLSIGTNPTVNGESTTVEVHILDFDQDIYGKNIKVAFKDFLHEQIKFENLDQLVYRLKEDERLTRLYFETH